MRRFRRSSEPPPYDHESEEAGPGAEDPGLDGGASAGAVDTATTTSHDAAEEDIALDDRREPWRDPADNVNGPPPPDPDALDGAFEADVPHSPNGPPARLGGEPTAAPPHEPSLETARGPEQAPVPELTPTAWVAPRRAAEVQRVAEGRQRGVDVVGDPGSLLEVAHQPARPAAGGHRPSVALDLVEVGSLVVGGVSIRGALHHDSGTVRQDAFALGLSDDRAFVVASIADGVSQGAQSHLGAEWASQQAVVLAREELTRAEGELDRVDWGGIARTVRAQVRARAEHHLGSKFTTEDGGQARPSEVPDREYAKAMGATAELLVVAVVPDGSGAHRAVRVVISGDGSGVVLDGERGWWALGMGKAQSGGMTSNTVLTLPIDPGPPVVQEWKLEPGQAVAVVTDGIGDPFEDGSSPVAAYLHDAWRQPIRSMTELLRTASFVRLQADDDRTAVVVWACKS